MEVLKYNIALILLKKRSENVHPIKPDRLLHKHSDYTYIWIGLYN